MMTFEEILDQAIAMLQRRGRLTYRAVKRQFNLDDAFLDDLTEELIHGQQVAMDEDGKVLVWTGGADRVVAPASSVTVPPASAPPRAPLSYTPPYLTEKILDARPRLEGERKQVTVLFADIKDSTELIRDLDPEAAQQLLDPALCRLPLGEVHLLAGRHDEARALAEGALGLARAHQERGNEAYALRLLGGIAAHRHPLDGLSAETYYQQSLTLAEELGMRPLMAHCHLGLGRLYLMLSRRDQAHIALSAAIEMYRAMGMSLWRPVAEDALTQVGIG